MSFQQKHHRRPDRMRTRAAATNAGRNPWNPSLATPTAKPRSPESLYPEARRLCTAAAWKGRGAQRGAEPYPVPAALTSRFHFPPSVMGSFQPSYGSHALLQRVLLLSAQPPLGLTCHSGLPVPSENRFCSLKQFEFKTIVNDILFQFFPSSSSCV